MSINPLNDISKVYLEQVVTSQVEEGVRPGNVEKPLDKAAFKKRRRSLAGKEKSAEARKRGHEGKTWADSGRTYSPDEAKSRRANMSDYERSARHSTAVDPDNEDHSNYSADKTKNPKKQRKQAAMGEAFVDPEQGEAPSGRSPLQNVSDHPKASVRKKAVGAFKTQMGKEYGGTWKSRSKDPVAEAAKPDYLDFDGDGNKKEPMKKALKDKKKVEEANDGNLANNYPPYDKVTRGDVIAGATGKDQMGGKKKKVKEGFSNWRHDLIEITDKEDKDKKVTEKAVNNKIKINPKLGEAIEELGGVLVEMIEFEGVLDEIQDSELLLLSDSLIEEVVEEFFLESLDEGYDLDEVEEILCESLETSLMFLNEASDSYYDSAVNTSKQNAARIKRTERIQKVKDTVKKVGSAIKSGAKKAVKGAAYGAGYAAGAAVRGAKAVGKSVKAGYAAGKGTSPQSGSTSGSTSSASPQSKKPGLLSRIGSALKRGLKKAVVKGARAVASGATKLADKVEGKPQASSRSPQPYRGSGSGRVEKAGAPKAKPTAKKPTATKPTAKKPTTAKPKKKDKLDDLLSKVRSEELDIHEDEYRKLLAKERQSEKEKEAKRSGFKSINPGRRAKTIAKDYANTQMSNIKYLDKKTKGKHTIGNPFPEHVEYELDEKTLTPGETKKKEEIVKSMKDKESDFEKRYPGRGKEVMYATATKMAKKIAEQMADVTSPVDQKKEKMDQQKLANMKMMQQKQQMLQKQRLQMQRQGKLPLENEELQFDGEVIDERRKEDKVAGTPRKPRDRAFEIVAKSMGAGRMGVQPRGQKKVSGKKPPTAGEYGAPRSPAQKVAMRRAAIQRSQDMYKPRAGESD